MGGEELIVLISSCFGVCSFAAESTEGPAKPSYVGTEAVVEFAAVLKRSLRGTADLRAEVAAETLRWVKKDESILEPLLRLEEEEPSRL